MRTIVFLFTTLLLAREGFSQQTLIPYRVGDKWGLSDIKGAFVLNPVYDDVDPVNYSSMFITKKNGKYGAVYNGREVMKPVYKRIMGKDERFFTESYSIDGQPTLGSSREIVYNVNGERVMPDTLYEMNLVPLELKKGEALYVTYGIRSSGVFVYNDKTKKIQEWILRRQDGLLEFAADKENKQVEIYRFSRRSGNAKFVITYDAAGNKYKVTQSKEVVTDPELVPDDGMDYRPSASNNHMVRSIEFVQNGSTIKRITTYQRYKESRFKKDTVTISDEVGEITINKYFQPNGYELYQFSNEPFNTSDLQDRDTVLAFRNYLSFRKNGKLGWMAEDTLVAPQFESIRFFNPFNRYKPYFLVSKQVNGGLKYGVLRSDGITVLPVAYDTIIMNAGGGYATLWILKQDGKYGIALNDGTIVQPPQYDSIVPNNLFHSLAIIHQGKYGYYDINKYFCAPLLTMRPTFVTHFNKLPFLRITKNDNELVCYAGFDGTMYYRSKP